MKKLVLFCTGLSGSGKTYFINNYLPSNLFHNLKSATTRAIRPGEVDGREYYFRDEAFFDTTPMATRLWVNEAFWTPNKPKWLYGVPEFEIFDNMGANFIYDVIQPKYIRQLMNWFYEHKMGNNYSFKTIYFISPENNFDIANRRANMPDDMRVRRTNTCNPEDFLHAGLDIDFLIKCSQSETILSPRLIKFISRLR